MTLGEFAELALGIPDITSAVDEILAPLAGDVELAYALWSGRS